MPSIATGEAKTSRLLLELSSDESRVLASALAACPTSEVTSASPCDSSALPGAVFYVVEDGTVLVVSGREGRRLIVAVAGRGSLLVPPAEGEQFAAVASARLTAVVRDAYESLLHEPRAAAAITDGLIDAVSDREETLANFARYPYSERVRAKLLQLARRHGRVSRHGVVIALPLTHDLIAEMVGSSRETVTWALRDLTNAGFIAREGRFYRVNVAARELSSPERRIA